MRILRLPAYFYPELMASTHLQNDRLEGFAKAGHTIVVYTPIPTRGIDKFARKNFKRIKYEELYDGRVQIHRFSLFSEGKNPIIRALRYILCCVKQYFKACKAEDIDAIYASSTPPIQGIVCKRIQKKLSKKQGKFVPIIYNLQDIFPDSLVTTGMTKKNSIIWKIGRYIENKTYEAAQHIIVISKSFKNNIISKGVSEDKITVISNWIDIENTKPISRNENKLIEEYHIDPNKFIIVYAGNFGAAQGADVVVDAADILKDRSDIQFVIFGGGSEYENVFNTVNVKKLTNVIINPLLPQERISEVYSLGDVALITCKKGVGNSGMPSKTWSIMACNTPIIASFDLGSELDEIIRDAKAGFCVEPQDNHALANAILDLKDNGRGKYLGGREYAVENISKDKCVGKYIEVFEEEIKKLRI